MAKVKLRDGEYLNVHCIGHGQPVLLLHGFGSRGAHWLPNILPFIGKFRFYLPDLRGFGGSHHARLARDRIFSVYAQDLEDILNHFKLDNVILGGISTGAYACLVFNQEIGFGRVIRYLNIEHSANSKNRADSQHGLFGVNQDKMFAEFQALIDLINHYGRHTAYWDLPPDVRVQFRNTAMRLFRRSVHNQRGRQVITLASNHAERLLTQHLMPVDRWHTYLDVMSCFMQGHETIDALQHIKVPTTLMIGKHSRLFSEASQRELASHIPHADVVVFQNSGHIPIVDEPIKFQLEFSRFLQGR